MDGKFYRCDDCINQIEVDETSVGAGYVKACKCRHWECEGNPEDEQNYDFWDDCKDYKGQNTKPTYDEITEMVEREG